jgi:hypothetical protein
MGDPELRSDETILLRTPGVFVKSIAFEGFLTNKRIILIDRIKNLLPQKEIPLVTIKDIESGENAIRDQIITLSILAKNGETRQMILTFSRQTGGNRIRERNEWVKLLKENTSSSIDQVIRKVIPGGGPVLQKPDKKPDPRTPPRLEVISSPVSQNVPAATKPPAKKERESIPPVKKIIENRPDNAPPMASKEVASDSTPSFGTYCSRCGNRVPEGSGFCNRCGSQIVVPGSIPATPPPLPEVPQAGDSGIMADRVKPIDTAIQTPSRSEYPVVTISPNLPLEVQGEPVDETKIQTELKTTALLQETAWTVADVTIAESEEKPGPATTVATPSSNSESLLPKGEPPAPQKPSGGFNFRLNKKAVIGIIIAIIIVAVVVGAFFLYPMISNSVGTTSENVSALTAGPEMIKPAPTIIKNSGTAVFQENTLKPTTLPTTRPAPGNSGSKVGL